MTVLRTCLSLTVVLALSGATLGCATGRPVAAGEIESPELRRIADAFARTVYAARSDPAAEWHAGWLGNVRVNFSTDRPQFGLCHHWQDIVYAGVIETVRDVGWEASGIRINYGAHNEHHAVVVWDPARIARGEIVQTKRDPQAWVLDAWRRGEPDVFRVAEWERLPSVRLRPVELESITWTASSEGGKPWARGY